MGNIIKRSICGLLMLLITGCSLQNANRPAMEPAGQSSVESTSSGAPIPEKQTIRQVNSEDLQMAQYQEWRFDYHDIMLWLPNGEYFARFFTPITESKDKTIRKREVELYNTDNERVRHFQLPSKPSDKYEVIIVSNSGFIMEYSNYLWKDSKGNYRISDTQQYDWNGNLIREYPEIEEKIKDNGGNRILSGRGRGFSGCRQDQRFQLCLSN